jgi:ligand-binding sensor domain-containing protein/class 3 adenylate cyclase/predicted metal-dependent HD superfamily phosphohydrolase
MKVLLRLLFIFFVFAGNAQHAYRFRNYTINNGLSQSAVTALVQDEVGALWLGTQDGLNRFDGQTFENFTSDETEGLENEYIHCAIRAKNGFLWFGTGNGITSYNPKKEEFSSYQIEGKSALQVESILEDRDGSLWIASASDGLYYLKKNSFKIKRFSVQLPSLRIKTLASLSPTEMFISTEDKGLYILNVKTKSLKPLELQGKTGVFVRVNVLKEDDAKNWILGTNQGLYLYNPEQNKSWPLYPQLDRDFGNLEVNDIWIESSEKMFIATKSNGLFTVIQQGKTVTYFQNTTDILQPNSLLYNAVNKLFKDVSGTFWVGTERGLGSFDPLNSGFVGFGASANLQTGLPSSSVWCFGEDPKQRYVFVGTDNAISRYDRKAGKFLQYFREKVSLQAGELNQSSILSMHVLSESELLVGATDGLFLLRIYGGTAYSFEKIKFKNIANASNFERIYQIVPYKNNTFFLASKGGALLYDRSKSTVTVFEHDPKNAKNTIGPGICRLVVKDLYGKIWFSTSAGGLYELVEGENLKIVPSKLNNSILNQTKDYITSFLRVNKHEYWLGTMGSGLLYLNAKTKKARTYTKKDKLPNNVVYGVLKDQKGFLWLSTNKGICKFDLKSKTTTNFTEVDGLMSNEFNSGAFFRSEKGDMYFGGIFGYNTFNPNNLQTNEIPVSVGFTKLKLDKDWLKPGDESKVLGNSLYVTEKLMLSYKQRSFTIKFMALNMSNPALVSYKYLLEGSDEGEIFIGNSNQIHFTSLQSGDYTLKVYARLGSGEWSKTPAVLSISVAAPFWKTAWFWILVAAFVALAVYVFIRKQIENERREQVRLEMKIMERTREIREQNIQIAKQKRTIEEKKNHLEEQKRLLEVEKEKTEKLLKNIMPESTYEELKTKGKASARAYKTVSVMFTDFVGFTKIAETLKPSDLVNELDIYFRKFDEIIVRNNLEKIKTIGDAYMCAGGVPVRNNTNPIDACLAALQIQESMRIMRDEARQQNRVIFDLRLGINTGEVTAGVIGSEKLAYDIWGSTVNQAQRMEMLGEPGKVTISGQTFTYIEPYFVCTFRGKVKTKSSGFVDMYTVDSIKPELSIDGKGVYPNEKFKQIVNLHFYSSINYYKAERHIMKVLEKKLSPKLHYHSIAHTKDVCNAIERIALEEGVTDEGLFLLKSAATYHDAGFVESYEKNEPVGARMAEEILPKYGYSEQHIEQIKKLIYVTQIPHKPSDHLEEIICDADLDYLGRDDFHEIADKLRKELREHGKIDSDRKWDEIQVVFLTNHQYFTETAKRSRNTKKAQNLEEIKERLRLDRYLD